MKKVAIVIPHGDDEALGFGGAIITHLNNGDHVTLVACRGPHDERTAKQFYDTKAAKDVLNYQDIRYLLVTESEISNEPLKLFRAIEASLNDIKPDVVYTSFWGDIHQDHGITYNCVARAVRVWGPLAVKQFFVGEIPSSTDQAPKISINMFTPNWYLPLTEGILEIDTVTTGITRADPVDLGAFNEGEVKTLTAPVGETKVVGTSPVGASTFVS